MEMPQIFTLLIFSSFFFAHNLVHQRDVGGWTQEFEAYKVFVPQKDGWFSVAQQCDSDEQNVIAQHQH